VNRKIIFLAALYAITTQMSFAEDAFYHVRVSDLKIIEGALPAQANPNYSRGWEYFSAMQSYGVLDGEGEIYVDGTAQEPWSPRNDRGLFVAIRTAKGKETTARLFLVKPDLSGLTSLKFQVPPDAVPTQTNEFYAAKESYYRGLLSRNIPGGAWFRHQAQEAATHHGATNRVEPPQAFGRGGRRGLDVEDSYDLFTGGRALSENLQLDRLMNVRETGKETVDFASLQGITVQEMNWKTLVQGLKPETDPLAAFIPADQHALFFSSFTAMTQMLDEADTNGTPVLQLLEPRSEDSNTRGRYQTQLCLGLNELSRVVGPRVIDSIAFTGSDPYLRVGTDVAILFEAKNPELLKTFIGGQQRTSQQTNSEAKLVQGEIGGATYTGVVSPDRSVSSYLVATKNVVFVSNSLKELERLMETAAGKTPALSGQDEYIFFRHRYARNEKNETAFLVLSDPAIRRWCSPQWRIADSRRTRAAAALSELQATHLSKLAGGKAEVGALKTDPRLPDMGEVQCTRSGVSSSVYGTLDFMTPIVEMNLQKVTRAEADGYGRWRDGYQQNWQQFFDPIAIRFSIAKQKLGAEMTVMPLIARTDYRDFIELSRGAAIAPTAGDPHDALIHFVMSFNPQAKRVTEAGSFAVQMAPGLKANPLGWIGQAISIYADNDPFWDKLSKATNGTEFLEKQYFQLPVALQCEVKNPLGLVAFLTALHAFTDQSAPKMTSWENLDYNGQAFVRVTANNRERDNFFKDMALYYAVTPKSFVLTLNEALLKRALDRQTAREKGAPVVTARPWLGTNVSFQINSNFVTAAQVLAHDHYQTHLQLLSWNNLPILNEWKRLYPKEDPLKFHERFWGVTLLCPGHGTYVWNDKWQTMESTVFGHPGEPKQASQSLPVFAVAAANLGLTFETNGLSAKAVLER
jgi:hypothetical protein